MYTYYICTNNIVSPLKTKNMWTKSHSIVSKEVTKEQIWKLFADVNNWHTWDAGIEYAKMEGKFEKGNHFELKPKGGPKVKIELIETSENKKFVDLTKFPLANMYGEHTFEETPNGLKITTTMKVDGLLTFLWVQLVAKNIANGLSKEMPQQIKFASKL
jgi:hypothetical protein